MSFFEPAYFSYFICAVVSFSIKYMFSPIVNRLLGCTFTSFYLFSHLSFLYFLDVFFFLILFFLLNIFISFPHFDLLGILSPYFPTPNLFLSRVSNSIHCKTHHKTTMNCRFFICCSQSINSQQIHSLIIYQTCLTHQTPGMRKRYCECVENGNEKK